MGKTTTRQNGAGRYRRGNQRTESGAIHKDWGGKLRVALTMPNTYYVGMSSLALQLLYGMFNRAPDVVCERIFWEKGAAQSGEPLLSLESERPAADFDLWAFTVSWEMDYFNVVELLRQAGIPPLAAERATSRQWNGEPWPLLIAGGPGLTMNPEPMAPFFDAILIGEGRGSRPPIDGPVSRGDGRSRGAAGAAGCDAGLVCAEPAPVQPASRRFPQGRTAVGAQPARFRYDEPVVHARHRVQEHAPDGDRPRVRARLPVLSGGLCLSPGA